MHRRTFIIGSVHCLVALSWSGAGLATIDVSDMTSEEFLALRLAVNNDYAEGNVVVDDGWIVSATEYNQNHPQ